MTTSWTRTEGKVSPVLNDEDKAILSEVYKTACMKHINKFLLKEGVISQEVYWKMSTKLISVENEVQRRAEALRERRERESRLVGSKE